MAVVAFPLPALNTSSPDDEDCSISMPFQNRVVKGRPPDRLQVPMPPQVSVDSMDDNEKDHNHDCDEATVASTQPSIGSLPEAGDEIDAAIDECLDENAINDDNDQIGHEEEQCRQSSLTTSVDASINSIAVHPTSYGGLDNLGNTCYLNSAMQMLASLDQFVPLLKSEQPAADDDAMEDHSSEDQSHDSTSRNRQVRTIFLEVMDSVSKGECVTPDRFKELIDQRTPLFVGFHQQDSHEFLTTLLDLIDEDYKVEDKRSSASDHDGAGMKSALDGDAMEEDKAIDKPEEQVQSGHPSATIESSQPPTAANSQSSPGDAIGRDEDDSCQMEETPAKKPRTVGVDIEPPCPDRHCGLSQAARCESFSKLRFEGIEELLHGTVAARNTSTPVAPSGPRYKLVGGRMTAPDPSLLVGYGYDISTTNAPASSAMICDNDNTSDDASMTSAQSSSPTKIASPVESNFKCEARVRLTCCSCKYTRTHTETFLHLSLEIGPDSGSVADGLRRFFADEKREIKCEKCFCEAALQTTEITRLPRALLLHFKRFIVDVSPDYMSITYRKNQSAVFFDSKLELLEEKGGVLSEFFAAHVSIPEPLVTAPDRAEDEQCYHIRSVVNHIGSSASCGHYTADANRLYSDGRRQWTRFNDSYVSRISHEEAVDDASRTAYMVMYELS